MSLVDLRTTGSGQDTYALIADDSGSVIRRDYRSDQADPKYTELRKLLAVPKAAGAPGATVGPGACSGVTGLHASDFWWRSGPLRPRGDERAAGQRAVCCEPSATPATRHSPCFGPIDAPCLPLESRSRKSLLLFAAHCPSLT